MIKKIETSTKTHDFNSLVEIASDRFEQINKIAQITKSPQFLDAAKYQLGYVCGLYKTAFDTAPGSVKSLEKELDTAIKELVTTQVDLHSDPILRNSYFDGFLTEEEAYHKAAENAEHFSDFYTKMFGPSAVLVHGVTEGYVEGIKLLCKDSGIPFDNPPSEENCLWKNWKFFFDKEHSTFSVDGVFAWGPKSAIKVEINKEIMKKLNKRPLGDFRNGIAIVDLSQFIS